MKKFKDLNEFKNASIEELEEWWEEYCEFSEYCFSEDIKEQIKFYGDDEDDK